MLSCWEPMDASWELSVENGAALMIPNSIFKQWCLEHVVTYVFIGDYSMSTRLSHCIGMVDCCGTSLAKEHRGRDGFHYCKKKERQKKAPLGRYINWNDIPRLLDIPYFLTADVRYHKRSIKHKDHDFIAQDQGNNCNTWITRRSCYIDAAKLSHKRNV